MRPPWLRALTSCLQMVVTSDDDIEVELGEVNVGQLRARAFAELRNALTDAQALSLAWFALADLACWPQLPAAQAAMLAAGLETDNIAMEASVLGAEGSQSDAVTNAAASMLRMILTANLRAQIPALAPRTDFEPLRKSINQLAQQSSAAIEYWENWLNARESARSRRGSALAYPSIPIAWAISSAASS
jgi:hypothetical protein